jgi:signal transduction histidine kinase/ligand-binding sensor protein
VGRYSFFGDVVAREDWMAIQEQLADAFRMEVHTLGPAGEDLCPPSNLTLFRQLLNDAPDTSRHIPDGRLDVVRRTGERGEVLVEETATGRLRFSVPILFRDEHLATVSGGGQVSRPMSGEQVRALARQAGVDEDQLLAAVAELEIGDKDTCYAAGRVIASLLFQLVSAVEHRTEAELQARRLKVLARVGQVVTDSLDLGRVLEAVVSAIPQVMEVKACLVALMDDDGVLRTRAGHGLSDEFMGIELEPGQGLAGTVLSTGQLLNVPDMPADPRSVYRELDEREGLRSLLSAPLRDGDAVIGVVSVFHGEPTRFGADEEQLLLNFADYTAAAVRNAQLYGRMRQAYRELGMATRRVQEAQAQVLRTDRLAEVGRLAGGAAHEMRNSLGGIIGAASVVRDRLSEMSEEDVREMVAAIADEGWRLQSSLEAVRAYAKPQHYGVGRHPLAEAVAESVRLLKFDGKFTRLPIEVRIDPDLEFLGDRDRFKQVLLNLLRNAGEAVAEVADRAPRVVVEAETETETAETGPQVVLRVMDNGCGIPEDKLERIWEPFYTTKGQAGTGLGLDLVRQMIQAQGGEIAVASVVDRGTVFTVRLPAPPPEESVS